MVSQTKIPVQMAQFVKWSRFNTESLLPMDYTHAQALMTSSIAVTIWRATWKEQGLLLRKGAARDCREWGEMQGAVQRTKEALMKRTVTRKRLEIEAIAVGRLEGI